MTQKKLLLAGLALAALSLPGCSTMEGQRATDSFVARELAQYDIYPDDAAKPATEATAKASTPLPSPPPNAPAGDAATIPMS